MPTAGPAPATGLVQPIALRRSGTHEDAVRAAAAASVGAFLATADDPAWEAWLDSGRVTKTVRRARPGQLAALEASAAAGVDVGDARALAFVPVSYDAMAHDLRKLQVSGTDLPRAGWHRSGRGPLVVVRRDLEMSTGKTAAQVAHALFGWQLLQAAPGVPGTGAVGPFDVDDADAVAFTALLPGAALVVQDAGFTEVEPGTATVLVLDR